MFKEQFGEESLKLPTTRLGITAVSGSWKDPTTTANLRCLWTPQAAYLVDDHAEQLRP